MRGSAPQAAEYSTSLIALPPICSIRWLDHLLLISVVLHPQNLSVPQVARTGNIQNPRAWLARPATQVILGRPPRTHNNCVAPSKLDINRVQSTNHFRNSRVVWLEVNLVRQGRP